jgi:hypothetical protein
VNGRTVVARGCTESKSSNTLKYLRDCRKECVQKSFGESSCEESTRGLVPLKYPWCGEESCFVGG